MEQSVSVFQFQKGSCVPRVRVEALDMADGVVCYGDAKGTVVLSQLAGSNSDFALKDLVSSPISKKTIDRIEFLQNSNMIAVLTNGVLHFLDDENLKLRSKAGKNITAFAVNSFNEQIAALQSKTLAIFSFNSVSYTHLTLPTICSV
eukprot:TRINITY_DN17213_c0_g4_i1.p1 TRINITY_DN17213_c0_g4~~TRINITY_DN17213_c0_g4_i1.p1  ORF type:complete len:160 (+),score=16.95 TRINITY_DN17213_c0_g4_i1:41-481(+)